MIQTDNMNETESISESQKFYGKYRGTVFNNLDPEQRGRIQAIVPDVSGLIPTTWAEACVPVAGSIPPIQMGMFVLPPIGAGVWIEFEHGDPDYPIWTGCYFGSAADVPTLARTVPPAVPSITLQTQFQNGIVISDMAPTNLTGGIMLLSKTMARIIVNDSGIYIDNGKGASIDMVGPNVIINKGALSVI